MPTHDESEVVQVIHKRGVPVRVPINITHLQTTALQIAPGVTVYRHYDQARDQRHFTADVAGFKIGQDGSVRTKTAIMALIASYEESRRLLAAEYNGVEEPWTEEDEAEISIPA